MANSVHSTKGGKWRNYPIEFIKRGGDALKQSRPLNSQWCARKKCVVVVVVVVLIAVISRRKREMPVVQ